MACEKNLRSLLKHPICAIVAPRAPEKSIVLLPQEHFAVMETTVQE